MSSESATTGSRRAIRIGKYEVLAHIATGGMGAVYRAPDTEENREVALKVLTAEMAVKPAMLERFRREGKHAAKLRHENIVAVYEFNEINGTYYIAMEFVEGIDLHDYIEQKGTLDPEESRQIMIQAARALAHAHSISIVHRDIKPSNFLVARKNNKVVIKLTDLGLARETEADEFRVTRAGTTVGTVDYISPEQARDSGSADVRSDIYSLGCTWFHMLAGHPPFPEGGLAERLYKHMEAEPPDIRDFNPRASQALVAVLGKMLAKKPADRHQDPTELLRALNELTAAVKTPVKRATVADVGMATSPDTEPPVRKSSPAVRKDKESGRSKKKSGSAADTEKASRHRLAERRRRFLYLAAIVGSILVVIGVCLALVFHRANKPTPVVPPPSQPVENENPTPVSRDKPVVMKPDPIKDPSPPPPVPTRFKPLYKPSELIDVKQLRARVEKPWANLQPMPADATVLHVGRVALVKGEEVFPSIEEAYKSSKVPAEGPLVIEIHDNGPLFEAGCVFAGRRVLLRAAKNYRPLIVWDHARSKSPTLFKVTGGGSLTLENLDLAVKIPELSNQRWAFFHVVEGDLNATGCTFSQAGNAPNGVTLSRFEGKRCRFTRCFARGNQLVALELSAQAAEVLFDGCLIVGGKPALLQVRAAGDRPANLCVVRSTLIGAETLLKLESLGAGIDKPVLRWFGWDSLLSRSHSGFGGQLLLPVEVGVKGVTWQTVNCLYAGWGLLLAGPRRVDSNRGIKEWQSLWGLKEGDEVRREMWPLRELLNVETHLPEEYRPDKNPDVGVASTLSGDLPIGSDIDALPSARKSWLRLVPDRFDESSPKVPVESAAPEIPTSAQQLYCGAKINLSEMSSYDVGQYLQDRLKEKKFAEKVVLHLYYMNPNSKCDVKFTPFAVPTGTSLTIYYEMKGADRQPLKLEVASSSADAVLAVENGTLELMNVEFRLPDLSNKYPPVLLKVQGDLRMHGCRLMTSEKRTPSDFKALIDFYGSGDEAPDKQVNTLVLDQTVLLSYTSNPACVRVFGAGSQLLLQQSLLVAAGDGVAFHFAEVLKDRANVQCWFQNCTIAARKSAVVLNNAPPGDFPVEPIFVWSRDCAFLKPFPSSFTSGVLRSQDASLNRGLLVWRSEGDAFDKRLNYVAASSSVVLSAPPPENQPQVLWEKLWGSQGVRGLVMDSDWPKLTFESGSWGMKLDQFETPPIKVPGMGTRTVGVKMSDLGYKKRLP